MFEIVQCSIESDALYYVLATHIYRTLVRFKGVRRDAYEALGVHRNKFTRKMKRYGIEIDKESKQVFWPLRHQVALANGAERIDV